MLYEGLTLEPTILIQSERPARLVLRSAQWQHAYLKSIAQHVLRVMSIVSADPDLGGDARLFGLTVQGDSS